MTKSTERRVPVYRTFPSLPGRCARQDETVTKSSSIFDRMNAIRPKAKLSNSYVTLPTAFTSSRSCRCLVRLASERIRRRSVRSRVGPQIASDRHGVDAGLLPPPRFVAAAVKLSVVLPAQRDGEFIAHLPSECPRLGKPEMMGIGGFSTADQARLRGHELAMAFVTEATWLGHDRAGCGWEVRCWRGNQIGRAHV